jgi:hypothetical protein
MSGFVRFFNRTFALCSLPTMSCAGTSNNLPDMMFIELSKSPARLSIAAFCRFFDRQFSLSRFAQIRCAPTRNNRPAMMFISSTV